VAGLYLVLTRASAAWQAGRDRLWAGIALGIAAIEILFILGALFLAPLM